MGQDLLGRTFWQVLDPGQCLEAPHLQSPPVLRPGASRACSKLEPLLGAVVARDCGLCSHSPNLRGEAAAQVLEGLAKLRAHWQL